MKKRIISLLLAVCMVLSLVPTMVFAEGDSYTVTVNAKTVDNPDTGDNSHMVLWIALALVSGSAMIGTTIAGTKKKRSAR